MKTTILDLDPDVARADEERGHQFRPTDIVLEQIPPLTRQPGAVWTVSLEETMHIPFYVGYEAAEGHLMWLVAQFDPATGEAFGYHIAPERATVAVKHGDPPPDGAVPPVGVIPEGEDRRMDSGWGHFNLLDMATLRIGAAPMDGDGTVAGEVLGKDLWVHRIDLVRPITLQEVEDGTAPPPMLPS